MHVQVQGVPISAAPGGECPVAACDCAEVGLLQVHRTRVDLQGALVAIGLPKGGEEIYWENMGLLKEEVAPFNFSSPGKVTFWPTESEYFLWL